MSEAESSSLSHEQPGENVPADSGVTGEQKASVVPVVLPPAIPPRPSRSRASQHTDYVVESMRGISASTFEGQVYSGLWEMSKGSYQALAYEVRELKDELRGMRGKLEASETKHGDLREAHAKLKGRAPTSEHEQFI